MQTSDAFREIVKLKIHRRKVSGGRLDEIDQRIKTLETSLTHEEAVFIVKQYET